jgi:hypothetical protein
MDSAAASMMSSHREQLQMSPTARSCLYAATIVTKESSGNSFPLI